MHFKRALSVLGIATGMAMGLTPAAQAITMNDILASQVKGDSSYAPLTITSAGNKSITVKATPQAYSNGVWTYKLTWARVKQSNGSVRVFAKSGSKNDAALSVTTAAPTGEGAMQLQPSKAYTVEFMTQSNFGGSALVRKSFTSLDAEDEIFDTETDAGGSPALSNGQGTVNTAPGSAAVDANGCLTDQNIFVQNGNTWTAKYNNAIWSGGCWKAPATGTLYGSGSQAPMSGGYPITSTPQANNGLNGAATGAYAGKSLASLGAKTSAPALGAGSGSCAMSNGWTINSYVGQYGYQFVQAACGSFSKQLFLYSIDYCTSQTDCFHHDYTGQYKMSRNVLEQALGHTVNTISFDPTTVDPFNAILFTDRSLEAKCVALRNHGGQLDMYDAQCGTRTGLSTDTPIQMPAPVNSSSTPAYTPNPYAGMNLSSLGTRTSVPGLGSNNAGCTMSDGWTVPMYRNQYGSQFVQYACGALNKQLYLYSIDYCTSQTDCFHHDYSGQYKIPRDVLEKALGHAASTISFDPVNVDPFNSVLFDANLNAKCVSPRNHNGQLDMYDAQCGTHTGLR